MICFFFQIIATHFKKGNSNHDVGQINSIQINNSKNGLFSESSQLSDSRPVDLKQIMPHLATGIITYIPKNIA